MINNSKTLPKVYYGLHMAPGVAEYKEPDSKPYRILIGEETIKNMDSTFQGRPVYVQHVDEVNLDKIQIEADGYVVESFFNSIDGKHWVKFIVVSDKGHEAIRNGWRLSNSYIPKRFSGGGLWHGVEYSKEIIDGEYDHLAIVQNPRYDESVILTPEQFKNYNGEKEIELKKIANAKNKETNKMKLNLFKKQKIENELDLENTSVILPKCQKEKTLVQLVNEVDEMEEKKKENLADPKAMVKLHDGSVCNVGELVEKHKALHTAHEELKAKHDCYTKNDETDEDVKKKALDIAAHEEEEMKKKNMEDDAKKAEDEKKKNEEDEKKKLEEKKKNEGKEHFESLKNAHLNAIGEEKTINLTEDQVVRGKARYGSGK